MKVIDFKQLTNNDISNYKKILSGMYSNSEASVASMLMWQHYYNASFTVHNDTIYSLYKDRNGCYASFMPYGEFRNTEIVVDNLINFYADFSTEFTVNLCTSDFVGFLTSTSKYNFDIIEKRNSYDYIYQTSDLINLPGKKYHSKKNHINSFNKLYSYEYVRYEHSMKDKCIEFCNRVLSEHYKHDEKSCMTELLSIQKAFDNIDDLDLKCGMLCIGDDIIAITVGERLNKDYALIHIEKADYKYRTAYTVINNLFLKNEFSDTLYVNREEDMGIDGIRKAKMSYKPCFFIEKYSVNFKIK